MKEHKIPIIIPPSKIPEHINPFVGLGGESPEGNIRVIANETTKAYA